MIIQYMILGMNIVVFDQYRLVIILPFQFEFSWKESIPVVIKKNLRYLEFLFSHLVYQFLLRVEVA